MSKQKEEDEIEEPDTETGMKRSRKRMLVLIGVAGMTISAVAKISGAVDWAVAISHAPEQVLELQKQRQEQDTQYKIVIVKLDYLTSLVEKIDDRQNNNWRTASPRAKEGIVP